jgi:hypothetical protein
MTSSCSKLFGPGSSRLELTVFMLSHYYFFKRDRNFCNDCDNNRDGCTWGPQALVRVGEFEMVEVQT